MTLDKAVVNRFIKHAIASAVAPPKLVPGSGAVIGNHLRFNTSGESITARAAEKIAARNASASSSSSSSGGSTDSEVDGLDVMEGDLATASGSAKATPPPVVVEANTSKRKRAPMDPFAGYTIGSGPPTPSSQQDEPVKKKKKSRSRKDKLRAKQNRASELANESTAASTDQSEAE